MKEEDCYKRIRKKTSRKKIPFTALWELTYNCNLRCVHCYITKGYRKKELTTIEAKYAIDQLASAGTLYLVLTGGEILTRPDFFQIAAYARSKGFALRLSTNGTLITPGIADRIKDLYPLNVGISLYAMDPEIHDQITRIKGSFHKTTKALELLRQRGVRTVIKSVIMKFNVSQFRHLRAFAEKIGSQFIYDLTVVARDNCSKAPLRYRLSGRQLTKFLMEEGKPEEWKPVPYKCGMHPCGAGINTLTISPHGEIQPCLAIRKSGGNLKNKPLSEIWQSRIFKEIRSITTSNLKECLECEFSSYCSRCPGIALVEDGSLLAPSSAACTLARIRKRIVDKLTQV